MNLKIVLIALSLLISIQFLTGCHSNKANKEDWREIQSFVHDTFRIDLGIREQADLLMEGEPEVETFDDRTDKVANTRKKSSTVTITVLHDNINEIDKSGVLRCIAYLNHDTLVINNSFNTGFGGKGVTIKYTGKKLSSDIYESTDVVFPDEEQPSLAIEKQKLALDKSSYAVGDSLHGHLYLRMIDQNKVKYYAQGFFRARVAAER
jgi:hypothetical protein